MLLVPFLELYRPIRHFVQAQMATDAPLAQKWTTCWGEARSRTEHNFAFHEVLQSWFSKIKFYGFGATTSDFVHQGHDGWLYFTLTEERRCIHRTHPFTDVELEQWGGALENWRAKLAERGTAFYAVIAPDKHTIYDDSALSNELNLAPGRMDQLYAYLKDHTAVSTIDVRPALRAEKDKRQLYYKTDTHWNSMGAFVAFQQIASHLRKRYPNIPVMSFCDYTEDRATPNGMDLGRFAGVADVLLESTISLHPKVDPRTTFEDAVVKNMHNSSIVTPKTISRNASGTIPRMLVLRDSFTIALLPFLATLAQETTFVWWWQLEWDDVETAKPDVVLFELVERDLHSPNISPKAL